MIKNEHLYDHLVNELLSEYWEDESVIYQWTDEMHWVLRNVNVNNINIYGREPKYPDKVEKFYDDMRNGDVFPTIVIKQSGKDDYSIISGRHRLEALRLSGISNVECLVGIYWEREHLIESEDTLVWIC